MLYEAIMHAVLRKVWTGGCACVGPSVQMPCSLQAWFEYGLSLAVAVYRTCCLHPTNAHMSQGGRFTAVRVNYSFEQGSALERGMEQELAFDRCEGHEYFQVCHVYNAARQGAVGPSVAPPGSTVKPPLRVTSANIKAPPAEC